MNTATWQHQWMGDPYVNACGDSALFDPQGREQGLLFDPATAPAETPADEWIPAPAPAAAPTLFDVPDPSGQGALFA